MAKRRIYDENTIREKDCLFCGKAFEWDGNKPHYPAFLKRKFCSKSCAGKSHKPAGFCFRSGKDHPKWTGGNSSKRGWEHYKWVDKVIAKYDGKCDKCGATEVELHAHHIKTYKEYPELRYDIDNGVALCAHCHWDTHSALTANKVNSVNTRPSNVEGNTEPSLSRKAFEGVTTKGRACRRVVKPCHVCGNPVSRSFGEYSRNVSGLVFCDKKCMGKHHIEYTRLGSNSHTSALHESDDIV